MWQTSLFCDVILLTLEFEKKPNTIQNNTHSQVESLWGSQLVSVYCFVLYWFFFSNSSVSKMTSQNNDVCHILTFC